MYFWWVREFFLKLEVSSTLGLLLQQIPLSANEFDEPQLANTGMEVT